MELKDLAGQDLGTRTIAYDARDAILYALAVGASSDETDLVYERDLRVLPTYACALGLWAVEKAGGLGAYDRNMSLHAAQSLELHAPMPRSGSFEARGRVAEVWDKGKAAIITIVVECETFTARYGIFLPGRGGWGGERGPSASSQEWRPSWQGRHATNRSRAALYRLTGDLHPIHIDIEVARANGFDRPILHGLCTLGIAARVLAEPAASSSLRTQAPRGAPRGAGDAGGCDRRDRRWQWRRAVLPGEGRRDRGPHRRACGFRLKYAGSGPPGPSALIEKFIGIFSSAVLEG